MFVFAGGCHILAKKHWEELWDKGVNKCTEAGGNKLGLTSSSVIRMNIATRFNSTVLSSEGSRRGYPVVDSSPIVSKTILVC